jgi:SAM-dependent methyltransferase
MTQDTTPDVRTKVRESYGRIAASQPSSCCGPSQDSAACCGQPDASTGQAMQLYESGDIGDLPTDVTNLSLGCGDPVTLASLEPGQTVLDLGSGGGIDCFLAAKRVGETGHVIGVDMTAQMIQKARANQQKVGAANVEFRLGEIEHLPVADASVDVIISNCVINLSPDKPQVFREAYRVLKPGGRLAVSDIVTNGPLPDALRQSLDAWAGCVGGAMDVNEYVSALKEVGFVDVEYARTFTDEQMDSVAETLTEQAGGSLEDGRVRVVIQSPPGGERNVIELDEDRRSLYDRIFSAKITAYKPLPGS